MDEKTAAYMRERTEKYYKLKSRLKEVDEKIKGLDEHIQFYVNAGSMVSVLMFNKQDSPEVFEKMKNAVIYHRNEIQKLMDEI